MVVGVVDGAFEMTSEETVWDDLRVAAQNTKINPAQAKPDFVTFLNTTLTYHFDAAAVESVHFSLQMPHGYALGTDLKPHVHWTPTSTNEGGVVWGLEYTIANLDGTFPGTSKIYIRDVGDGTSHKHQYAALPTIDGSGITSLSTMIICRLFRDADGSEGSGLTDDYTGDAAFLEFDLHYQIDQVGSREELVK